MAYSCDYLKSTLKKLNEELTPSTSATNGRQLVDQILKPIRDLKNQERATQGAEKQRLADKIASQYADAGEKEATIEKTRFTSQVLGNSDVQEYIRSLPTTDYANFREEVRATFGGPQARIVEQVYKDAKLTKIEQDLKAARKYTNTIENEMAKMRGEGLLRREDLDKMDYLDALKTFDYNSIQEGTARTVYTDLKKKIGEPIADEIIQTKVMDNIAKIDERLQYTNVKDWFFKKLPSEDETKLIDDIWTGERKADASTLEATQKLLDKISDSGWNTLKGAIKPLEELENTDKTRIVKQMTKEGTIKKLIGSPVSIAKFTLITMPSFLVIAGFIQQTAFENSLQFGKWSADQTSENQFNMFLAAEGDGTRALMKRSADMYLKAIDILTGLPVIGRYYDILFTVSGARATVAGFQQDATRVYDELVKKGLAIKDPSAPWGYRALTEEEKTALYKSNPATLFKNDQAWIEKEGSKIYGDWTVVSKNGKVLTATQVMALYYSDARFGNKLLTDADAKKAGLSQGEIDEARGDVPTMGEVGRMGAEHDQTTRTEGTAGTISAGAPTQQEILAMAKQLGWTEEQVRNGMKGGFDILRQGEHYKDAFGEDKVCTTAICWGRGEEATSAATGPISGGGGVSSERQESIEAAAKEKGFKNLDYASKNEGLQNYETLGEAEKKLGASDEDIQGTNKGEYSRLVKNTIESDKERKELSKKDIDKMAALDKETTTNALYSAYCE